MRNKIIKNDPEKAVGNIYALVVKIITDSRQIALNEVVAKLRKGKMEIEQIRDVQEIGEKYATIIPMLVGDRTPEVFWTTSLCWFPLYEVDFGWGTPVQVKYAMPKIDNKHLFLIDTPHRDGIEAIVRLPEDEMMIFQKNEELLTYLDV
ncbi:putative deacetylvindoline O-acetyltransferase [Helianthus annuus]|nr:putative deacetylvindoline O-acetyltransferase [Helianthus annuus]KAJ0690869.1 putative deacetylvindoline O-acetyltransferase [Helianthus annuus]KAJ0872528.1 putative deacetylvindoline O-acetyltransferase [Helianthus annuus]